MKNYYVYPDELYHYGIKGMKWGVRRYQNEDGSYTEAGKKRLNKRTKYRDTFANKAKEESERFKSKDLQKRNEIKELKQKGKDSKAYKKYIDKVKAQRARDYEHLWEDGSHSYDNSLMDLIDDIEIRRNYKKYYNLALSDLEKSKMNYRKKSKKWMETHDNLMNMEVTPFTSKRDIRREYWK